VKQRFRVTHPFHPLSGSEFELIEHRLNWGEDRVYYLDEAGELRSILASCTDVGAVDPSVEIAAGRALFRFEDLLRLAALLAGLQGQGPVDV
jgi:hypothetical protein